MRIAWIADLHLGSTDASELEPYIYELQRSQPDIVISAGDLVDGWPYARWLLALQQEVGKPLYFVLGNHECYGTSIAAARRRARGLHEECSDLHYLTAAGIVELTSETCLIGHDGWADGGVGDYMASTVVVTDVMMIEEFIGLEPEQRLRVLSHLGEEAADYFASHLPEALSRYHQILIVTHVPPFREACYYQEREADDNWSPHFVCHAVGEVLKECAKAHPDRELLVLCGHAHHASDVQVLPNLRVVTGFEGPFNLEIRTPMQLPSTQGRRPT